METAKQTGRAAFGEMVAYLKAHPSVRVMLVEKTDRLYRNLKDWVTVDELDVEMHFPKEGVVLSRESRSSEKFMHGIKVLMAKNYIDNLSEEALGEGNECANYAQIDPTHRHGHIDGRLGRRLASDVSTRWGRISPRRNICLRRWAVHASRSATEGSQIIAGLFERRL